MKTWMFQKMGLMGPNDEGEAGGGGTSTVDTASPESIFSTSDDPRSAPSDSGAETNAPAQTKEPVQQQEVQRTQQTAPEQKGMVAMSEEQLASLAAKMVSAMPQQAAPVQQEAKWTPEQQVEFEREFGIVRVTPEIFQAITGVAPQSEAQCKALETLLHGVVRQANKMTMYQVQQQIETREKAAMERFNPVLNHVQAQQAAVLENRFFTENPDLKDFSPLVAEVTKTAKLEGKRFANESEALKFVATRARGLLNQATKGGTTSPAVKPQAQRTMPTTSMGGRTGANNGSQRQSSGPQSVFGDLDDTNR